MSKHVIAETELDGERTVWLQPDPDPKADPGWRLRLEWEIWGNATLFEERKAAKAHFDGDHAKLLHHAITVAAVALNWHRNLTGEHTAMRPGVASP